MEQDLIESDDMTEDLACKVRLEGHGHLSSNHWCYTGTVCGVAEVSLISA